MSREHLFRGRRLGKKGKYGWIEGYYCPVNTMPAIVRELYWADETEMMSRDWDFIDPATVGEWTGLHDCTKWDMLSVSEQSEWIAQTYEKDGITLHHTAEDWPGKRIFEGDVIRQNGNPLDLAEVCFGEFGVIDMESESATDTAAGWYLKVIKTDALSACEPFCLDFQLNKFWIKENEMEVVGTIHDEPHP